jgi:hypothetical protein
MLKLDLEDASTIHLTRGDRGTIKVKVKNAKTGEYYTFPAGCTVSFVVKARQGYTLEDALRKTVHVLEDTDIVEIALTESDTKIGDPIDKKVKYWYNVVINDDQTIIGSDENGEKILMLYPEAGEEE